MEEDLEEYMLRGGGEIEMNESARDVEMEQYQLALIVHDTTTTI